LIDEIYARNAHRSRILILLWKSDLFAFTLSAEHSAFCLYFCDFSFIIVFLFNGFGFVVCLALSSSIFSLKAV